MNEWREERDVGTTSACWGCHHLIHNHEFRTDTESSHHGCWQLCAGFEPGFDLMSGVYPKCPLPKVNVMHYMSEDGRFCRFKIEPVTDGVGGEQ